MSFEIDHNSGDSFFIEYISIHYSNIKLEISNRTVGYPKYNL